MNKLYNDTAVQAIANAIRAKNGSSDTYTIAEMSTALNDISYYAKPIIENVPLAIFEADGLPLNSLKVSVEAKQDLHGYDKPWVGGSGKNKLPLPAEQTINGVTLTHLSDGGIKLTGIPTANTYFDCFAGTFDSTAYAGYRFKVSYTGSSSGILFRISKSDRVTMQELYDNSLIADTGSGLYFALRVAFDTTIPSSGIIIYPMLLSPSETNYNFASYSNICPISGWDAANVSDVDDVDNPTVTQTTTISLPQTVYGGEVDVVNGVLTITDGYIASYNGETLPSTWISSMDEYAEGTTPTTGAEVCYELANPTTINLTPSLIKSLNGQNNLSVDCGDVIELEYFKEV